MPEPTVRNFIRACVERLDAHGVPESRRSAEWIVQHVTGWSRTELMLRLGDELDEEVQEAAEQLIRHRMRRVPLQYVIGEAHFFGMEFEVGPAVLIPRPETEILVEEALRLLKAAPANASPRVLDVGTGSGCIACAIKQHADVDVTAIDVSPDALQIARRNANRHRLQIRFMEYDILNNNPAADFGTFDMIVSNPPYVPEGDRRGMEPEVLEHEPHLALFTGGDPLLFYRRLVDLSPRSLRPDGRLLVEVHIDYAEDVAVLARSAGMQDVTIIDDLTQRPRVVAARQP